MARKIPLVDDERWAVIEDWPRYQISDQGNVLNLDSGRPVQTSRTKQGNIKVKLAHQGRQRTLSVAKLVARAFVDPPDVEIEFCGPTDSVILLDGDASNVAFWNLAWRPGPFAWKYAHQLNAAQPAHYFNLPVENTVTGKAYNSILDAGMTEGLLFDDIWRSTHQGSEVFPNHSVWVVVERV